MDLGCIMETKIRFTIELSIHPKLIHSTFKWGYEKVSDQGPVWVRSEDKIPSDFISIHDIYIWLPEYSSVP